MKGNPLLKFIAAVAGVDPTMPEAASKESPKVSKAAKDVRSNAVAKAPLADRKRTQVPATARRARAR